MYIYIYLYNITYFRDNKAPHGGCCICIVLHWPLFKYTLQFAKKCFTLKISEMKKIRTNYQGKDGHSGHSKEKLFFSISKKY